MRLSRGAGTLPAGSRLISTLAGCSKTNVRMLAGASARPTIILGSSNQSRRDRIVLDISRDSIEFHFIPKPTIIRFSLPKRLASPSENLIGVASRGAFQSAQQLRRRHFRKHKHVNVIGHQNISAKPVMPKLNAAPKRPNHNLRNPVQAEIHRSVSCSVEVSVHPHKRLAVTELAGWRISGLRKASMQMPRNKEPFTFRKLMRQPAAGNAHGRVVRPGQGNSL
jgi:hypothetical protein